MAAKQYTEKMRGDEFDSGIRRSSEVNTMGFKSTADNNEPCFSAGTFAVEAKLDQADLELSQS